MGVSRVVVRPSDAVVPKGFGANGRFCTEGLRLPDAAPEFAQHALVMNGCSSLKIEIFQENCRHVRAAVGCSSLPRGVMVEARAVFELLD